MIENEVIVKNSDVLILGVTFKENCNDIRNSKIFNVISELNGLGINTSVYDYFADKSQVKREYDIDLIDDYEGKYDAVVFAVAHDNFKDISLEEIKALSKDKPIVIDLKSILGDDIKNSDEITYWSL